eukprot:TRINITY_DN6342_c0_g1_i6.p1 TRINITY_DN6342_c0_g1~~TRINITY_DN6342_c0_g1_i6.p1  ORF type:complete len:337 (-),score=69.09 TRINITY_DN6342_c0_g1_i6:75-1085(-)
MAKVAVVGAGIIGLSTALEIQKQIPKCQVTLISEKFTPDTTADGAAGIFGLYLLGSTQPDRQVVWAKKTHDLIESWWKTPMCGEMGIALVSCSRMNHSPVPPIWKDVVFGVREMSQEEVAEKGRLTGEHTSGLEMLTFTAEPVRFMPFLMKQFKDQGGEIKRAKVENFKDLFNEYDCVVNCTGVYAGSLTLDKKIKPLRGQVMRVKAPWIKTVTLDDLDDGNYVIANQESVVVGGTHQDGDWDRTPREEDKQFIRSGGKCLDPSLKDSVEVGHWVGLRPGRPEVRLERDGIDKKLVHNYGHGGSGITVFQGCAEECVDLVKEVLQEQNIAAVQAKL